jgi:uncharacterized damage-inducible protein DinB
MRMRKTIVCCLTLVVAFAMGVATKAQDVTQADKDRALAYLEKTKAGVIDATKGLSDAQWNFKPGPDRWSIAEVMEHVALAEDMIRGLVQEQIMKSPAIEPRDPAELKKIDDGVLKQVPDRSHKIQAPEQLKPTNHFGTPEQAEQHFVDSRATTEAYLKDTAALRAHAMTDPMGTKMDGYEWILLIAAHSERHTKQILEVKADPKYPKS